MKTYTFDEICDSQDFDHNEKFVLLLYANKEINKLKKEIEELKKKTGYSTSLFSSTCNNCGHMDKE